MIIAAKLAGFFAAHAIWSVADGEALVPMLAFATGDGERHMARLAGEPSVLVPGGQRALEDNDMGANDAALLYDGFITIADRKLDAILIEVRTYFSPGAEMVLAVPYSPRGERPFRVHKPKLLEWNGCDDFDRFAVLQAFLEGADEHEEGSRVWASALDESI